MGGAEGREKRARFGETDTLTKPGTQNVAISWTLRASANQEGVSLVSPSRNQPLKGREQRSLRLHGLKKGVVSSDGGPVRAICGEKMPKKGVYVKN